MTYATTIPADLKAQIDKHMELFRGFVMMADSEPDPKETGEGSDGATDKDAKSKSEDEALGPAGLKALQEEREARKLLEKQVTEMSGTKATLDALKAALGPEATKVNPEDAVKAVTSKVEALERQLLVERVAREHKISSADDIKMLGDLTTEEQIRTWAKRLAPEEGSASDASKDPKKGGGRPKVDPSAGKGGGDSASSKSVAEIQAERRAAREAKAK